MTGGARPLRVSVRQSLSPPPFRTGTLKKLVLRAIAGLGDPEVDVRVLVVGDAAMARANARFRNRPETTNVLSFPEEDAASPAPGRLRLAGDILVSAPTCMAQTRLWEATPEERILFFIVHGMVHLMGHDHVRGGSQARRMRRLESAVYRAALAGGRSGSVRRGGGGGRG